MKHVVIAAVLAVRLAAAAEPTPAPQEAVPARPSDEAIQKAIRDVLDENPEAPRGHQFGAIRGNKYNEFSRQFSQAKVPDCLHPDALKFQPPTIGPIAFGGLYAVPFVVLAKVRGKCL